MDEPYVKTDYNLNELLEKYDFVLNEHDNPELFVSIMNGNFDLSDSIISLGSSTLLYIGHYLRKHKIYDKMKNYYLKSIEKGNINAMVALGYYYSFNQDHKNMEKYYLMAIKNGSVEAMILFGMSYMYNSNHEPLKKYLLMAIEKGSSEAMGCLAIYYQNYNKIDEMEHYYVKSIEKDNVNAMINYGNYFLQKNDLNSMKKYYLMALKHGSNYIYNEIINFNIKNPTHKFGLTELKEYIIKYKLKSANKKTFCYSCHGCNDMYYTSCGKHYICVDCAVKLYKKPCVICTA